MADRPATEEAMVSQSRPAQPTATPPREIAPPDPERSEPASHAAFGLFLAEPGRSPAAPGLAGLGSARRQAKLAAMAATRAAMVAVRDIQRRP